MLGALSLLSRTAVIVSATVLVLSATAIVAALIVVGSGHQVLFMESGSMQPEIQPGDLVVVGQVQPQQIRTGDVITFDRPEGYPVKITHRVIKVDQAAAGVAFVTKGDANGATDPWKVHYLRDAWRVTFTVPFVGLGLVFLQGTAGHILVAALIFLIALSLLLPSKASRTRVGKAVAGAAESKT